jgi:hypothetical protein
MDYFQTKKSQFGYFLEVLEKESVGIPYGHLEYLRSYGVYFAHLISLWSFLYIFIRLGKLYQEKSGNPGFAQKSLRATKWPIDFPRDFHSLRANQGDQIGQISPKYWAIVYFARGFITKLRFFHGKIMH